MPLLPRIVIALFIVTILPCLADSSLAELLKENDVKGGLVVHLGCGDGAKTAALRLNDAFIVHGLDRDNAKITAANKRLLDAGLSGAVSVELLTGTKLPYAEELVNCVIAEDAGGLAPAEIMRVLVPGGVSLTRTAGGWKKSVKPMPSDIDQWTHFLHDASNNAVAKDTRIGPPRRVKWVGDPLWLRSHETPSGVQAMIAGGGRMFYILDEGLIGITDERLPDRWSIYARDAFNGKLLWKRRLDKWGWREWALDRWKGKDWTVVRAGRTVVPKENHRRLVVDGDRLFTTLSYNAPLTVLDAATGRTIATTPYQNVLEIAVCNGVVLLRTSDNNLVAIDRNSLKLLWKKSVKLGSIQYAAVPEGVVCFSSGQLSCFDLKTGASRWTAKAQVKQLNTLVAHPRAAVLLAGNTLLAHDMKTGKLLWKQATPARSGFERQDLFIINDRVWAGLVGADANGKTGHKSSNALGLGRNLLTGAVEKKVFAPNLRSPEHHHRCYRNKATSRYIISSLEGAEFFDTENREHLQQNWVRGVCTYGMMPAYGQLYVPPDQCFCSPGAKLLGFTALVKAAPTSATVPDDQRLSKGPAYGKVPAGAAEPDSWPTLRRDPARSGSVNTTVAGGMTPGWTCKLGGELTAPVAANGRIFVARKDRNAVVALSQSDGRILWRFVAAGAIDSPPTLHNGNVLFGAKDGRVYCLRASNGAVAWTFLAAPWDRRIVARERLESAWPLHGSVLVVDNLAYVAAGRSTYLDGGIYLYAINIADGAIVHKGHISGPHKKPGERGKGFFTEGANTDVLVAESGFIYMRQEKFTKNLKHIPQKILSSKGAEDVGLHIFSTAGLLDGAWYNRTFWMYSKRWPGFQLANQAPKAGQLLVHDDRNTYALRVFYHRNVHSPMFFPQTKGYLLFADKNTNEPQIYGEPGSKKPLEWLPQSDYSRGPKRKPKKKKGKKASAPAKSNANMITLDQKAFGFDKGIGYTRAAPPLWTLYLPVRIRGMVKTNGKLFVAGAPDIYDNTKPYEAFEGKRGAKLVAVSDVGKKLSETDLPAPPVFDGLIATQGKLFIALRNGTIVCMQ